jgi:hypothetical protein
MTEVHNKIDVSQCASSKVTLHFEAYEARMTMATVGIKLELELDLLGAVDVGASAHLKTV